MPSPEQPSRPRIGLTGGIASGKSSVAEVWAELGAVVVDSDVLAREVVEPGTDGLAAVVDRFDARVLAADGTLDRAALGQIVFDDPSARADLEAIIHPLVRRRAAEQETAAPPESLVVQVIPLLVETGQEGSFDQVAVVDLDPELQVARLRQRNGLSEDQARARVAAQASREERLAKATLVIGNGGTPQQLREGATAAWRVLLDRLRTAGQGPSAESS